MLSGKKFWGKHFWFVIHYASLRLGISDFFLLLSYLTFLLPCWECREHLRSNIEFLKKEGDNDSFLVGYRLHSLVNYATGVSHQPKSVEVKSYYMNNGSVSIDSEVIFVIRAICFKFDHHWGELKKFIDLISPLTSLDFRQTLNTYPLTPEYETQNDLFFWSFKLGDAYQTRRKSFPESWSIFQEKFSSGMNDDCDQCSLK